MLPQAGRSDRSPGDRPSAPRGSGGILLAQAGAVVATEALHAAKSLASAFDAPLVVFSLSGRRRQAPWRPRRANTHSSAADFSAVVATAVHREKPELVVVPDSSGQSGHWVRDLALRIETPVLLARDRFCSDAIVVASDLTTRAYPVLRMGALLSLRLHKRLLFVHNLRLTLAVSPHLEPSLERFSTVSAATKMNELASVAQTLGVESENVVTAAATPAVAILRVAERDLADITVVGACGIHDEKSPSVAQQVIDGGTRNVLIVPF